MSDKTEKPTARRRQKSREQGEVARSRELASAVVLLSTLAVLSWFAPRWVNEWRGLWSRLLNTATSTELTADSAVIAWTASTVFRWTLPLFLAALTVNIAAMTPGGFVFAWPALMPKLSRLSPMARAKQIFSLQGTSRILKSLIPTAVVVYLAVAMLSGNWARITHASRLQPTAFTGWMLGQSHALAWNLGICMLLYAGADYWIQRTSHERSLKMTKQEIREETKETEGNMAVKGRIRRLQRQMRSQRMFKDVATASVVITNPTHFAVALRYDMASPGAPVVVAKGQNKMAEKLKAIARWHDIPIVENRPLARTLYRTVEVGRTIPIELYSAVAEILAFIYRAQERMRKTTSSGGRQ